MNRTCADAFGGAEHLIGRALMGVFAGAALGIYGLFALLVAERRRELGVRMALGAEPGQVVRVRPSSGGATSVRCRS